MRGGRPSVRVPDANPSPREVPNRVAYASIDPDAYPIPSDVPINDACPVSDPVADDEPDDIPSK
jgi:hypothetical protein